MEAMAPDETDQGHRRKGEGEEVEDGVQDQIRATEQEIRAKQEAIRAKDEAIRAKEEEITELRAEIRAVETEIAAASGKIVRKSLEAKLQFLRQEIISRDQHIVSLRQEITSLRQEITSLRQEITSLRQEINSLQSVKAGLVSAGRATRDVTVELLERLIQPFDRVPESLDVVELRNLLTTDLRTRIPCASYSIASNFSNFLQHSTTEECPRLQAVLSSFLIGPRRPMVSSENALIGLWDRLVVDLPQLIHEVLYFPISTNRNVVDESLSTSMDKRDYLLYLQNLPVVFGEEKRFDSDMREAVDNLRKKHRGVPGKHIYGRLGYVMCYAAAGQSRFQLFAVPVGIPYPRELSALTGVIDPSLRLGRVELLKTFVNVIRWIYTVHRQEFIGGLSLHSFYEPFTRPSPYGIGVVEITLFGNHVKKSFEVPTEHLHTLLDVYRVLCSGRIPCSIQLERMTVDGRAHLPEVETDSEETDSELSYALVELKLRPIASTVKPRDETDFKLLVSCILKAIVGLHEHGICHRDIRMANILRTPSEWILIDFELAGRAGDCVFWNSSSVIFGSEYRKDQDLKQLAGVIENSSSIAGPSLLQFAVELKRMGSAAQALAHLDALP